MAIGTVAGGSRTSDRRIDEARPLGRASCLERRGSSASGGVGRYFFTVHLLVASSHVPLALSQSAFVAGAGASAANAGALNVTKRPVTIAMLRILADI